MGNGVSGDQGNLPAHGKRDVREGIDAMRHDWSELAKTREIVTSPPIPTSYRINAGAGQTNDSRHWRHQGGNLPVPADVSGSSMG